MTDEQEQLRSTTQFYGETTACSSIPDIPFPSPQNPSFTFIDLFAGIGGFRLAMQSLGGQCVFSSEWDKQAQQTYFRNFGEVPFGDITEESTKAFIPDKFDILCAGFPCQPFSIAGDRKGFEDTRGTLFFDIVEITKRHRPKVLFLENVKNLQSHNKGNTFLVIKQILEKIGYNVYYKVLNASHFGLPQNRERLYIIGFHKSLMIPSFEFPFPTNEEISIAQILEENPTIKPIDRKDILINKNLFDSLNNRKTINKPLQIGYVNKGGQGERIYHPQGHGITLSASGGGVGAKTGLFLTTQGIRRLTPRECARLQGFPEKFKIHPNNNYAYKQFGNSVAINVVLSIAQKIIYTFQ